MDAPTRHDELPVILKAYDLAREMTARAQKLPRDVKFVLGDRMMTVTYDVLDLLIELKDVKASVTSWIGHLRHGDTWGLRRRLLADATFGARTPQGDLPVHQGESS